MNDADQASAVPDERRRRGRAYASLVEVYFYFFLFGGWIALQYFAARPRGPDELLDLFTRASIIGPIGILFLVLFDLFLTGRTPLVHFIERSRRLRLDPISIKFLEEADVSEAEIEYGNLAERYLSRSAEAARAAQRRPNALLFAGTFIAAAGLGFFILTLPGGQLGTQPITEASSDQLWVAGLNLLPRLLMLIFIQVLAGFFLRQYRSSMEEFRYYEAILRYRESQYMSYVIRKSSNDKKAMMALADELLRHRAFGRLGRGESTAIIESQRAELNEFSTILEKLAERLKGTANKEKETRGKPST